MNKLPWFRFFPADWIKGTRPLSSREKGIWIDLLANMWENEPQGQIEGSWEAIARMVGEPWLEVEMEVLKLERQRLLEIVRNVSASCPQNVRIVSRRMSAECTQRECDRRRQERRRESERLRKLEERRKSVTDLSTKRHGQEVRSQKSEVIKDKYKDIVDQTPDRPKVSFETVWGRYPVKDGRKAAERSFNGTVKTEQDFKDIQTALANYLKHLATETWKKPKNGATWFNNWRDWIAWDGSKVDLDPDRASAGKLAAKIEELRALAEREYARKQGLTQKGAVNAGN